MGDFDKAVKLVLEDEGGFVNNKKDPGGATNYGITKAKYESFVGHGVTVAHIRTMKRSDAISIYLQDYWRPVRGDALPTGVNYCLFDYSVNSGVSRAVKEAQRIVKVRVDGIMGAVTENAITNYCALFGPEKFINVLCDRRMAFLKRLSTWSTFGKGWTKRVKGVRADSLAMAAGVEVQQVARGNGAAKANPEDTKTFATKGGVGSATGGIGLLGTAVTDTAQQLSPFTDTLEIVKWVFMGLMLVGLAITLYATIKNIEHQEA